jgi:hypothetical protein
MMMMMTVMTCRTAMRYATDGRETQTLADDDEDDDDCCDDDLLLHGGYCYCFDLSYNMGTVIWESNWQAKRR